MPDPSTKPYLIRAIYDWCTDSGLTPYIAVAVGEGVHVPVEYVKNGEIVLNVSNLATNRLKIGNDAIEFQARFGGVPREVHVPVTHVIAVYARENGQGMAFEAPRPAVVGAVDQPAPGGPETGPRSIAGPRPAPAVLRDAAEIVGLDDLPAQPPAPPPGERPKLTRIK